MGRKKQKVRWSSVEEEFFATQQQQQQQQQQSNGEVMVVDEGLPQPEADYDTDNNSMINTGDHSETSSVSHRQYPR